jgi:hypothetical protein
MAKNMKDKQAQYDKCMAQSAQYKFQCPSRCLAHSLLQRLIKKLGEHHILALLVEPKILEEPDARIQKIIQAQKNHKINTPQQPQKRPLNVQNGYNNSTTKKPRNSFPNLPRVVNSTYGISNSRASSTASSISSYPSSYSKSFSPASSCPSIKSIPSYRPSTNMPPPPSPTSSLKKSSTPCLVSQIFNPESAKPTGECHLKIRNNGSCSYFTKKDSSTSMLTLPQRKYEITQNALGISKICFNTKQDGSEYKLCLNIIRFSHFKKFKFFGMAFRDNHDAKLRCTAQNDVPDEKIVSVVIPLRNISTRLAIFSVWFNNASNPYIVSTSNPEVMCAPIMVDLFSETGINYVATFEPDIVEIDD